MENQINPIFKRRFLSESVQEINNSRHYFYHWYRQREICEFSTSIWEEKFNIFMGYVYVLLLFKQPGFNPDKLLCLMIFCPDHLKVNNAVENYEAWSCIYRLDECTISKIQSKNIKREDFFSAHLSNWFWKSADDGSFNIIDKFRKLY